MQRRKFGSKFENFRLAADLINFFKHPGLATAVFTVPQNHCSFPLKCLALLSRAVDFFLNYENGLVEVILRIKPNKIKTELNIQITMKFHDLYRNF